MRVILCTLALSLVGVLVAAQDPVETDGDKYELVLENERVRVLEYRDEPGDRTRLHRHPDFVMYVVGPFTRRLTLEDGRTIERAFTAGQTVWMDAQAHSGENIGSTDTHVFIIELLEQSYVRTTGGKGLHVGVPLLPEHGWDALE